MGKLLPDQLKDLWQSVVRKHITALEFTAEQERLMDGYRKAWGEALLLGGCSDLQQSLLLELGRYTGCSDLDVVQSRCTQALGTVKDEWEGMVKDLDRKSVEQFYDESRAMIYELMWWHTLADDPSPLSYVLALEYAVQHGCRTYLDFGAGVGSGGILFARRGLDVTLADISSSMLDFSRWRFELRDLPVRCIDLKVSPLPRNAFDMVTAMDVFEHLVDPVSVVEELFQVIKPGGFLFGRFHAEVDPERPHHIVRSFQATLDRLKELGFVEVWKDEWLWGHLMFQRV